MNMTTLATGRSRAAIRARFVADVASLIDEPDSEVSLYNASGGPLGPALDSFQESPSPAAYDVHHHRSTFALDSLGVKTEFTREEFSSFSIADGAEDGFYQLLLQMDGTLTQALSFSKYGAGVIGRAGPNNGPDLSIGFAKKTNGGIGQVGDIVGTFSWYGVSSDGYMAPYVYDTVIQNAVVAGAEQAQWRRYIKYGASTPILVQVQSGGGVSFQGQLGVGGASGPDVAIQFGKTANGGLGQAGDEAGYLSWYQPSSTGAPTEMVYLTGGCVTCVNGSSNGLFAINILANNADVRMAEFRATAGVRQIGFYGVTPVARAAAIASPTNDTTGTKAAIDAIRVLLTNVGLSL